MLAAGTAAVAVAAIGGLAGAAPARIDLTHRPVLAVAAPVRADAGGGDGGRLPQQLGGTNAGALTDGTTNVHKTRTVVTLPRTLLRTYANNQDRQPHHILYNTSPVWAVTHIGPHPHYGVFPPTHVSVLGFGAVPITATLHLTQPTDAKGFLTPLVVRSKGQVVPPFKIYPTRVDGPVLLRLSDVRVDQVPLRVGPACRTVTPVQLHLVGLDPHYNLFTGGPLNGTTTIPAFTGCGSAANPLDRLITGSISGPGVKLHLVQGSLSPWNTKLPRDCRCRPPAASS
jgi:hypothetical protein